MKENKNDFVQAIHQVVRTIPRGRATSYGAIAKAIGYPNMSRMVGRVMSQCDSSVSGIPAHRVVNSQGQLSGCAAFGSGYEMQQLLEQEGIVVHDNRIRNWKTVFWDPLNEISL